MLAPHPRGPQPSALGDFSVPTAQEGRAIPVVIGTCMIKGGNTVWWGDLRTKAIKQGGGILSFGRTQVTGYKYFLGCQFMLCHTVDALVDIQADGKHVPYTTSVVLNGDGSENFIQVNATGTNLFGGTVPGGGGGISGAIDFFRGLQTQQPDDYLTSKQGRIVLDQSGIGDTYSGVGNGTITSLSAGSSSLDETFTITAAGIDTNATHSTFNKMRFTVVGSRSGAQSNITANAEGSHACWADQAFSCSRINLLIATGSTQFSIGDTFTVITQHATIASAYRGFCYAVFRQLYVGTSNYLKPLAFVVRRCPDPLAQGSGVANISGDANPALAVYDLLTNVDYGLGIPLVRINATSFTTAASTLAAEALGISMQFDTQASADQLIGEILRHCDGLLYTDPATGLWTIVLARGGYDPTALPVLTVDNVLATPDFSRGSWSETTNLVNIRYSSRAANFDDRSIRAYDPANISVTGEVRPQTIDFKGISSEAAAGLVAIRVLKTLTYPLSKIKLVVNRTAWQFRPGGLFRFTWIPLGIINQVFRITRIGYGELTDGKITMDAVEDIFGISSVAFVSPPSSGWVNPNGAPQPNAYEKLMEMPLHILIASGNIPPGAYALAVRNLATAANSFDVWRDDGSGYFDTGNLGGFCPIGFLSATYPLTTLAVDSPGFILDINGIDLQLLESCTTAELFNGKNLCLIDGEIMSWQTVTANPDGTYSISGIIRGVMDTVPTDHAPGAQVWFLSEGIGFVNPTPYAFPVTLHAKLLPMNSFGTLPLGSATAETITTANRAGLPYPAGNLRMQGLAYGTRKHTIVGDLVLTFSCRNRDIGAGVTPLHHQDDGDDPAPTAALFTIYRFVNGLTVGVVSTTTPPSASFTYTAVQRNLDSFLPGLATVKIFGAQMVVPPGGGGSVLVESFQPQQVDVIFTGFGMVFGEYFGGLVS